MKALVLNVEIVMVGEDDWDTGHEDGVTDIGLPDFELDLASHILEQFPEILKDVIVEVKSFKEEGSV
jgi:hypothetical protein